MRHPSILLGALALGALPALASAQGARTRVSVRGDGDADRPVIGVSTMSSGERDTLGLLVVSITPGGPADQAGIEEGNRIAAVNGTSLRLSAADAGEQDMQGMTTRRLVRELRKVEPGAEVTLRVWQNGSYRDVRVKTVAAEDLPGRRRTSREEMENRGVLGLRLGGGSRRDSLGVLVVGLTPDGPAEKAGIVEGDRIQAIGDVDLRVPAADAGDRWASNTRVNRFMRELRDLRPGQTVTLRLRSGGQTRTVNLTAVAAKDLADEEHGMFFFGDHIGFDSPMPAIAPMPPLPPSIERAPMRHRTPRAVRVPRLAPGTVTLDFESLDALDALDDLEIELPEFEGYFTPEVWSAETVEADAARAEAAAEALRAAREAVEARERAVREREARVRAAERPAVRSASWSSAAGDASWTAVSAAPTSSSARRSGNTLSLPGLTLSLVNRELASYFGDGAERGLLVLSADGRWDGLREGDVILAVDGRTTAGFSCVTTLAKGSRALDVLRGGRRVAMRVNGGA